MGRSFFRRGQLVCYLWYIGRLKKAPDTFGKTLGSPKTSEIVCVVTPIVPPFPRTRVNRGRVFVKMEELLG